MRVPVSVKGPSPAVMVFIRKISHPTHVIHYSRFLDKVYLINRTNISAPELLSPAQYAGAPGRNLFSILLQ